MENTALLFASAQSSNEIWLTLLMMGEQLKGSLIAYNRVRWHSFISTYVVCLVRRVCGSVELLVCLFLEESVISSIEPPVGKLI